MKITFTNGTVPNLQKLERKLSALASDLSVAPENQSIGSGLGGNRQQFEMVLAATHVLAVAGSTTVQLDQKYGVPTFHWDAEWLSKAKLKDMRSELNKCDFEGVKKLILAETGVDNSPSFVIMNVGLAEFAKQGALRFAGEINSLLTGKSKTLPFTLPCLQFAIMASVATSLATEMDVDVENWDENKSTTLKCFVGLAEQSSPEILLSVTRDYLGLERIVKQRLDEYPIMDVCLRSVAQLLNTIDDHSSIPDPNAPSQTLTATP
jgi:hypothetical protein